MIYRPLTKKVFKNSLKRLFFNVLKKVNKHGIKSEAILCRESYLLFNKKHNKKTIKELSFILLLLLTKNYSFKSFTMFSSLIFSTSIIFLFYT